MTATIVDRFMVMVAKHLAAYTDRMVASLRRIHSQPLPADATRLHFEIFPDGLTEEFPMRLFAYDSHNREVRLPGVDCDLLDDVTRIYDAELEHPFLEEDDNLPIFLLGGRACLAWFTDCWRNSNPPSAGLPCTVGIHDHDERRILRA